MSNTISLTYEGRVKLTLPKGGKNVQKVAHNEGYGVLFRLFASAIVGEFRKNDSVAYLNLVRDDSIQCLYSLLPVNGYYTSEGSDSDKRWVARVTSSIPYSSIIQDTIASNHTYRLYLMSVDKENLASLEMKLEDIQGITVGTQALVEWTLVVENPTNNNN